MSVNIQQKRAEVAQLMNTLQSNSDSPTVPAEKLVEILDRLKIHGRDPRGADSIYCDNGFDVLCKYAFDNGSTEVSQGALRIIANALLLQPQFRVKFAGVDRTSSLVEVYNRTSDDDEFLGARILFLLTYENQMDFSKIVRSQGLAKGLYFHLNRHAQQKKSDTRSSNQIGAMAMLETLKLVFNLANALGTEIQALDSLVQPICIIFSNTQIPSNPLDPPVNTLINALAILNLTQVLSPATLSEPSAYQKTAPKLLEVLRAAIEKYSPAQLETTAIPLLTVLRKVYEVVPAETRTVMQRALLPDDSERDLPLGQSSSLASKLLRLTSTPGMTHLPESISAFLFELSDKDANTYVKNIGYGYAAGYLMTHKIPIPEGVQKAHRGDESNTVLVNPITGQRLDKEVIPETIDMTNEEKEREAERLFVLFERLKATGVVDVQNPIELARDAGRFEEVDDSDSDSDSK